MKDIIFDSFQNDVSESLLRHKSILDIITKYAESSCRINRAVAKSVTNCGCIEIKAKKQCLPNDDNSLEDLSTCLQTHLDGCLCDNCREVIEREISLKEIENFDFVFISNSLMKVMKVSQINKIVYPVSNGIFNKIIHYCGT